MKFKGDIIITDPCYIDTDNNDLWNSKKINIFEGKGLESLGFTNYIWESTIYGDWSCCTFELKKESVNKPIKELTTNDLKEQLLGKFCADAGLVGVFLLDEVLAFNPNFDSHIKYPYTTTLIKDFDGEVTYEVVNDEVFIKGVGNVNFITIQTGL